ncbi:DUF3450 domain-containing protein [Pleionea litopenaei]|uniref:DUF3450 domain-containing protein n=1 Tax=Pleionea litopenaei TaxID=3070815 RepID=A0AA51X709_9GAMM|nr:DUF3450 domain-containing protein [Pleionea sp. HL-JVS1]WMS86620.1 DUF3450 domain-containing protein [Pleionea sp. HL-JVS1]
MFKLSVIIAGLVAFPIVGNAAESLEPVIDKSSKITESAANSQKRVDAISDQIDDKLQAFKSTNKETEGLKIYNLQLAKQIESQIQEMADLNQSIDKVSVIERQITPLMLRMIDGLEDFVKLDVPFLEEERKQRIASLKSLMDQANVAVSEKFRRVLEAYQIELDYGRTIEAYTDSFEIDGQPQDVDFLRIGRIALMFQSRDKRTLGVWNQQTRQWENLDKSYASRISQGLRMARKQMAPDLLTIPVFSAE